MNATDAPRSDPPSGGPTRFPVPLMVQASRLYYMEDLTQAEIARELGTSRASVSRLLSEARRQGIVQIEIAPPPVRDGEQLARDTANALGLQSVHLAAPAPAGAAVGVALGPALSTALAEADLHPGDVLLTATGRMVYEASQGDLPHLPGVVVAPMVGGQDEPEAWYQTNEITRRFAEQIGGRPSFLYAPALPGPELYPILRDEPSIRRILDLWRTARCAVMGVGAPPLTRQSIPAFVPTDAVSLREAVGDVCSRFIDRDGREVPFPGSDRLMAPTLEAVRMIPVVIAAAVGQEKINAILAAARGGYFNRLVTDTDTAEGLLSALARTSPRAAEETTAAEGGGRRARDRDRRGRALRATD